MASSALASPKFANYLPTAYFQKQSAKRSSCSRVRCPTTAKNHSVKPASEQLSGFMPWILSKGKPGHAGERRSLLWFGSSCFVKETPGASYYLHFGNLQGSSPTFQSQGKACLFWKISPTSPERLIADLRNVESQRNGDAAEAFLSKQKRGSCYITSLCLVSCVRLTNLTPWRFAR